MPVATMAEQGPIGSGAARAVALGGGGEWFIAWMLGYADGLLQSGVDLAQADVTIGTPVDKIRVRVFMTACCSFTHYPAWNQVSPK